MIRTSRSHVYATALTHPGMSGRQNEDRFAVSAFRLSDRNPVPAVFAIVSDGIGGHSAGEVAAELAVETISRRIAQSNGNRPLETLEASIQGTSESIAAKAKDDTQRLGMGTTCACAWIIGNQLFTASVGDSRIYLVRGGSLSQLTVDHTWVQEAIEKGILRPEQARNHPNLHVIRRYLGSSKPPQVDSRIRLAKDETDTQARSHQGMRLLPGDVLLLCTDGLTDEVSDAEILAAVSGRDPAGGDLGAIAQVLVDLVIQREGPDNITLVLLEVPEAMRTGGKDRNAWWFAGIVLAACLAVALAVLGAWLVFWVFLPPSLSPPHF